MRYRDTCSLWVLAMAASACTVGHKLGDEFVDGSTGGGGGSGAGGSAGFAGQTVIIDDGGPRSDADACRPNSFYGPQPCDTDSQCIQRHGSGWYCDTSNTYSDGCGSQIVWPYCKEAIEDGGPDAKADTCVPNSYYGPQPCSTNSECVERQGAGWYCDTQYTYTNNCGTTVHAPYCKQSIDDGGPDAKADTCRPLSYYGPQPCSIDSDCVQRHGAGWYCDTSHKYPNGCGGYYDWPMCEQSVDDGGPDAKADACEPYSYYGPPPCNTDSECIQRNGAGWYCDTDNSFVNNCGTTVHAPYCKQSIDDGGPDVKADTCTPVSYYGPQPCSTDPECVQRNGAGWYCDTAHSYSGPCGDVYWPLCRSDQ